MVVLCMLVVVGSRGKDTSNEWGEVAPAVVLAGAARATRGEEAVVVGVDRPRGAAVVQMQLCE